jgi:hypothetical protein
MKHGWPDWGWASCWSRRQGGDFTGNRVTAEFMRSRLPELASRAHDDLVATSGRVHARAKPANGWLA